MELLQTETFRKWRMKLKDERARSAIALRLARLSFGHVGDFKSVGDGINELRVHYGPGYRIYIKWRDDTVIILLCGGNKDSQTKDIETAKKLASEWSDQR